ncbi:hypothetical protein BKA62DRAFT_814392 [Auriculariales sp. MPI-PUGE-AT-0066]|nr:hypothetical protein BKA62DRAFT_814392 [Auriculariales sp. MPI-PUGE-AT-0066]
MPALPTTVLNGVFGTLLIATWFNALLLGLEISELERYFSSFPDDALWIRAFVVLMVCLDLLCTYGGCRAAYAYLVTGWGNLAILQTVNFKNRIISVLLCVPALAALICGLIITINTATKYTKSSERPQQRIMVRIWSISSTSADTVIAIAMMHLLYRLLSPLERTTGLLKRLMRNTILSGVAPAILCLSSFLSYQLFPLANTAFIFSFNISRAGTLTVLYNLNDRKRSRLALQVTDDTTLDDLHHHRARGVNVRSVGIERGDGSREVLDSKSSAF